MALIDKNILSLFSDIYMTSELPFFITDKTGHVIAAFPNTITDMLDSNLFEFAIQELARHHVKEDVMMYFITDTYFCILCPLDEDCFLISIPISNDEPISLPFNFVRHFVKNEHISQFCTLLNYTKNKSIYQSTCFANLVKEVYCHKPVRETIIRQLNGQVPHNQSVQRDYLFLQERNGKHCTQIRNYSLYYEKDLSSAITNGDPDAFILAYHRPTSHTISRMSNNPIQHEKYRFIIGMYLFSHAAIQGGMDEEYALLISDRYCHQLDTLNNIQVIQSLLSKAGVEYCEKIQSIKGAQKYSPDVSLCIKYINQHLYENIRLKDLENIIHINRRTLTIRFKSETSFTIPEYVLKRKMEEAVYLLNCSNISISDISALLCFASQSHFTQQFKKIYNITPHQYRNLASTDKSAN